MITHPVILIPKLVVILIIVIVLIILHGTLPPDQFRVAVVISIIGFVVFLVVFWLAVILLLRNPRSRLAKFMILSHNESMNDGYRAAADEFLDLVGERGKAVSLLRPTGIALIRDRRIPVQTEGSFLPEGTEVEVVAVKGSRVIVREAQ